MNHFHLLRQCVGCGRPKYALDVTVGCHHIRAFGKRFRRSYTQNGRLGTGDLISSRAVASYNHTHLHLNPASRGVWAVRLLVLSCGLIEFLEKETFNLAFERIVFSLRRCPGACSFTR